MTALNKKNPASRRITIKQESGPNKDVQSSDSDSNASTRHPLESVIGSFRDDPLWDAMVEAIRTREDAAACDEN